MIWRTLLALLVLCAALPAAHALGDKRLTAYSRETWTTREGLPHNQVNAIAQTPDGYLWFATWEGLVRYNGQDFRIFGPSNTPALKDNGIRRVTVSPRGSLVVSTSRGGVAVHRRAPRASRRWRQIHAASVAAPAIDAARRRRVREWGMRCLLLPHLILRVIRNKGALPWPSPP